MSELVTPVDVGFAEFMAKLISEVFDAVVTAQSEQEERLAEMTEAAALELAVFAERYVSAEEIVAMLARIFPPRDLDKGQPSAIYVGSPYTKGDGTTPESPSVVQDLKIVLVVGKDYRLQQTRRREELLTAGVTRIRDQTRLILAEARQAALAQLTKRGLPHVLVDSGKVSGKLTFQLVQPAESGGATAPAAAAPAPAAAASTRVISPDLFKPRLAFATTKILPKTRLLVRQADERSPQGNLTASVFGEVEITFKTVT